MSSDSSTAQPPAGPVFWLFGLSGAGKSTLARVLAEELRARGSPVLTLDGDELRAGLCHGLGFSDDDRAENLRRAAEVAKLGSVSGLSVVASFITPLETHRQLVSAILAPLNFHLIHIDAPFAVCRNRDVKGLYRRAEEGTLTKMTGVSSRFEPATAVSLVIHSSEEPLATSAARLLEFAHANLRRPKPQPR